jgi:hypothetical protein
MDLVITKSLRQGRLVYPGPMQLPHAWAYLPDLAQCFVNVASTLGTDTPRFQTLHFEGHTLTGQQLLQGLQAAAAALDITPTKPWRSGGVPWGLMRLGGLLVPMWRELVEMAYLWQVPHALHSHSLRQQPQTPLASALQQTLRELGFAAAPNAAALAA